jgi:ABC-2 type transport system ATP-binding protein
VKVWEYLDFFAAAYNLKRDMRTETVDRVLDLTNLDEKRDAFVQSLSRGMQQRLCLAKCLVHDPKLLLLDEPASGLDPRARIDIKNLIVRLGEMGKTVIVSSHILPELSDFCNRIGIMERSKLLVSGDVDTIVRQLQPTRQLLITPVGGVTASIALRGALEGRNLVEKITMDNADDGTLLVAFTGGFEEQAALLGELIAEGHRIGAFSESAMDLEDVFMQVTTGRVH